MCASMRGGAGVRGDEPHPKFPGKFHRAKLQYAASLFFCSFYLSSLFSFYWTLRVASLFFASLIIRTQSYLQFLYSLRIPTYKIICRYRAFMWENFVLKFFFKTKENFYILSTQFSNLLCKYLQIPREPDWQPSYRRPFVKTQFSGVHRGLENFWKKSR